MITRRKLFLSCFPLGFVLFLIHTCVHHNKAAALCVITLPDKAHVEKLKQSETPLIDAPSGWVGSM